MYSCSRYNRIRASHNISKICGCSNYFNNSVFIVYITMKHVKLENIYVVNNITIFKTQYCVVY